MILINGLLNAHPFTFAFERDKNAKCKFWDAICLYVISLYVLFAAFLRNGNYKNVR